MTTLQQIWELYNKYVNDCLMFEDVPEEILGFDEYADLHHGVERSVADTFLQEQTFDSLVDDPV